MKTKNTKEQIELDFLRYFYEQAGDAFGPADHDVYRSIMESYKGIGVIPQEYQSMLDK